MNKTLKGFISIPALANNDPDKINRFGELSPLAQTYTREMRNYQNPPKFSYPEIVAFSIKDELGIQDSLNPTEEWRDYVLSIGQWLAEQHVAGQIPTQANHDRLVSSLSSEFTKAIWKEVGPISNAANSSKNMPEWILFDLDDGGVLYTTKLWLSDPVFRDDYDEYETVVLPPVEPIDLVVQELSIVQTMVKARDNGTAWIKLINDAKKNRSDPNRLDPETTVVDLRLKWVDPTEPASSMMHTFMFVHYGIAGVNLENQKAAVRDYLETNGDPVNKPKWPTIYPELYSETEFAVIPAWDAVAIPEAGKDIGLYSSSIPLEKHISNIKKMAPPGFSNTSDFQAFVVANTGATSVYYRGMQCAVLGNPNNKSQTFKLTQVYPDYVHQSTSHADFERMKKATQEFAILLNQAIGHCRTLTANDRVPEGFVREMRGGRIFLSFLHEGFKWMTITRISYLATIGKP